MNILTVIPITRSKFVDTLSYFTSLDIKPGSVVFIPLRKKIVHGIVLQSKKAEDIKTEIKDAPFTIKKLTKVRSVEFLSEKYINAIKVIAKYYSSNMANILDELIANNIFDNVNKLDQPKEFRSNNIMSEVYAISGDDEDRMSSWKSLIRQEFASKRSMVIYVPSLEDMDKIKFSLEKGIQDYIFCLHASLPKKKMIEIWQKISKEEHPVVILATPSFSVIPRSDVESIILERENSRGWISKRYPYIDLRLALENIAKSRGQKIFRSDSLLSLETIYRLENHEIQKGSPFKWRSISTAKDMLVNMVKDKNDIDHTAEQSAKKFEILSPELKKLIAENTQENTHLFIHTVRKGLATTTSCDDCGTIVTCNKCGKPMVLHGKDNNNFFLCHICGNRMSADITCINCGGYRLTPLGIGLDRVYEELVNEFSEVPIFKLDSDIAKTDKQINEIIEKFKNKPGSILLGTELALNRLPEKMDHIAIVSLDSLFALPDFRINEKIMYLIVRLREKATRTILVQTRKSDQKIFDYALKGNLSDFSHEELAQRKRHGFPPYKTLIKISITGKRDTIAKTMESVSDKLQGEDIDIFPAFTGAGKGLSTIHALLRFEPRLWPNDNLENKMKNLPNEASIHIDPESLL